MVVCPHFLAPNPFIRYRPISTIVDATGVLPGLAFRPSICIFGRWPRCQCENVSPGISSPLFQTKVTRVIFCTQIPSAAPVPARAEKEPLAHHPLVVPMVSFALLSAFCSYNTTGAGSLPKLYSACTGLVGIWGLWVVSGCFEWYR